MGTSLYRICAGLCISALLGAVSLAAPPEKKKKGPRAIAVVRWQLDEKGTPTRPVLIPVAILVESKLYDAGMYQPTPRPFALDPGTLYEAQDKGELLGLFTIENAVRSKSTAQWIGLGTWKSEAPGLDFDPTKAIDERPQARAAIATAQVPEGDGPPPKKKTKVVYDEQGRPVENPPNDDDQSAQPTGKGGKREPIERNPQVAKDPPKTDTKPVPADDDPDRPQLKRGKPEPAAPPPPPAAPTGPASGSAPTATAAKTDTDPDRPILKHGMPTTSQKPAVEKSEADPVPYRVQQRGAQVSGHGKIYDVVAISDADTSGPPKDYRFRAGADEREELQAKMQTLAQKALAAYLKAAPPQTSAASRTARKVPVPALEDVRFEMFDLDSNNAAELVFSARQSQPAGGNAYVTVVARTDINNNPRQIFSHVTIDRDLDVKPRLELVDAVDLLADGSAELLFRETGADGSDFIIYRVGPDGLEQVFRGASAD